MSLIRKVKLNINYLSVLDNNFLKETCSVKVFQTEDNEAESSRFHEEDDREIFADILKSVPHTYESKNTISPKKTNLADLQFEKQKIKKKKQKIGKSQNLDKIDIDELLKDTESLRIVLTYRILPLFINPLIIMKYTSK